MTVRFTGRLWLWVNTAVVLSLFVFIIMQSPILDPGNTRWGLITILGSRIMQPLARSPLRLCALVVTTPRLNYGG